MLKPSNMWSETVEWLRDANLVARIQKNFGVRIHYAENTQTHDKERGRAEFTNDSTSQQLVSDACADTSFCGKQKRNGYNSAIQRKNNEAGKTVALETDENLEPPLTSTHNPNYTVTNYFWYYLFLFGTELGDEIFYSAFIPFWFWNIDGAVGRRVVLVWAIIMSIGQALKDVICWPRPECPPAARLQSKWSQEYGMPSTHAMVGVSIPFGVVLFTMNRYVYPVWIGWTIACLWCTLVCMSRLYLGMHTVLDILAGLMLAILLMIPLVPLVDVMDYYILSNVWALAILVIITITTVVYYPCGEKWTPTRGDTTMVVSVTAGVHVGAWLNYNTGAMTAPILPPPYNIIWPSYPLLGRTILRTILGFCSVIATKVLCKPLSYATMCAILKVNTKDLLKCKDYSSNKNKILVDLVYKYITCFMIGVNTVYFLPNVFTMIGIERPTFYTEM